MTYRFFLIRQIVKQLLAVLLIYTLSRGVFFAFNYSSFSSSSFQSLIIAFLHGIRFDLSAILYVNFLFVLLSIPVDFLKLPSWYHRLRYAVFYVFNAIALLWNMIDVEYFKFQKKRTTFELFSGENDILQLLPTYLKNYWYLLIILVFLLFLLFKIILRINQKKSIEKKKFIAIKVLSYTMFIAAIIVGMRGGLQTKPLQMLAAAYYGDEKNAPLVLNTPFTVFQSLGKKVLVNPNYFSNEVASQIFDIKRNYQSDVLFEKKNVVIIILESFSNEYIGTMSKRKTCSPFLDSLMTQGFLLKNAYANGKKSNEAMPSIFASLPSLMDDAYSGSVYQNNELNTLPNLLKSKGYYSAFFHGGFNGSMNFDAFAKKAGFDDYFGMNEYANNNDFDGNWGIYDEPFFQYVAHSLGSVPKPFVAGIFSLSSHPPYQLPDNLKHKYDDMETDKQKSFRYTDDALRKFFEYAKTKNWYTNTLFVILPDHTPDADSPEFDSKVTYYQIPILFFDPASIKLTGSSNQVTQQLDVMPTILDYLHYDSTFNAFGESALTKKRYPYAINYRDGIYQLIDSTGVLQFSDQVSVSYYNHQNDPLLSKNLINSEIVNIKLMERILKAYIQKFNATLILNNYNQK